MEGGKYPGLDHKRIGSVLAGGVLYPQSWVVLEEVVKEISSGRILNSIPDYQKEPEVNKCIHFGEMVYDFSVGWESGRNKIRILKTKRMEKMHVDSPMGVDTEYTKYTNLCLSHRCLPESIHCG